jgi:predicted enzyme related to lactoylglutathione lyase
MENGNGRLKRSIAQKNKSYFIAGGDFMANAVPKYTDGYRPNAVPQSLKLIQGGSHTIEKGSFEMEEQYRSDPATSAQTVFNRVGCLYFPVDDSESMRLWYEKHFNVAGTRRHSLFWMESGKGLNSNFMTDEWIPGEPYEMFAVRFETDAIEELYERLSAANVKLEPLQDVDNKGLMFVFTDPQGSKFQLWQRPDTITQPLRNDVPALMGLAALYFPVSDREVTLKWYTEFLGVEVSESGQPITSEGEEFYFYKSLGPKRNVGHNIGPGELQEMIAMISVYGIGEMHHRMVDHGQRVEEEVLDREGCGIQFKLYDPDGSILDIWDLQTMVRRDLEKADSPNWKERFVFENCCFWVNIDEFFTKTIEYAPGTRHKRIQIVEHAILRESDPEGLQELLEALEQFGKQDPDWAFEIVYREE